MGNRFAGPPHARGLHRGFQEEGLVGGLRGQETDQLVHRLFRVVCLEEEVELEAHGLFVAGESRAVADDPRERLVRKAAQHGAQGAVEKGRWMARRDPVGDTQLPDGLERIPALEQQCGVQVAELDPIAVFGQIQQECTTARIGIQIGGL